jgi:hypothetical protein
MRKTKLAQIQTQACNTQVCVCKRTTPRSVYTRQSSPCTRCPCVPSCVSIWLVVSGCTQCVVHVKLAVQRLLIIRIPRTLDANAMRKFIGPLLQLANLMSLRLPSQNTFEAYTDAVGCGSLCNENYKIWL